MARRTERFVCKCGKRWSVSFDTPRCRFKCKSCGQVHSLPKRSPREATELEQHAADNRGGEKKTRPTEAGQSLVPAKPEKAISARFFGALTIGLGLLLLASFVVALTQQRFNTAVATPEAVPPVQWIPNPDRLSELVDHQTEVYPGTVRLPEGFELWEVRNDAGAKVWRTEAETPGGIETGTIQLLSVKAAGAEARAFADEFIQLTKRYVSADTTTDEGTLMGCRCVRVKYEDTRASFAYGRYRYTFIIELPRRKVALSCASSMGWETPLMDLMQTALLTFQFEPGAVQDAADTAVPIDPEFADKK